MIEKELIDRGFVKHSSGLWVNEYGEVFVPRNGSRTERFTYGCKMKNGYMVVRRNGKNYLVHRLVAECFLPNPDNKPCIDHINTKRNDNRVENLRWCTHTENMNNPLSRKKQSKSQINNNKKSKIVLQYTLTGDFVKEWKSTEECGRNGFSKSHICECCQCKRKTHRGFRWRYKEKSETA